MAGAVVTLAGFGVGGAATVCVCVCVPYLLWPVIAIVFRCGFLADPGHAALSLPCPPVAAQGRGRMAGSRGAQRPRSGAGVALDAAIRERMIGLRGEVEVPGRGAGSAAGRDLATRAAATAAADEAGLAGDDLAAAVDAAVLAAAARARADGRPAQRGIPGTARPATGGGADLVSNGAWLVKVSRAFGSSPLAREQAGGGSAAPPPAQSAPSSLGERPHRR